MLSQTQGGDSDGGTYGRSCRTCSTITAGLFFISSRDYAVEEGKTVQNRTDKTQSGSPSASHEASCAGSFVVGGAVFGSPQTIVLCRICDCRSRSTRQCSHASRASPWHPSQLRSWASPARRMRNRKAQRWGHSFRDAYHERRWSDSSAKASRAEAKVSDFAHCRNS
jgi:hypothetical protein